MGHREEGLKSGFQSVRIFPVIRAKIPTQCLFTRGSFMVLGCRVQEQVFRLGPPAVRTTWSGIPLPPFHILVFCGWSFLGSSREPQRSGLSSPTQPRGQHLSVPTLLSPLRSTDIPEVHFTGCGWVLCRPALGLVDEGSVYICVCVWGGGPLLPSGFPPQSHKGV